MAGLCCCCGRGGLTHTGCGGECTSLNTLKDRRTDGTAEYCIHTERVGDNVGDNRRDLTNVYNKDNNRSDQVDAYHERNDQRSNCTDSLDTAKDNQCGNACNYKCAHPHRDASCVSEAITDGVCSGCRHEAGNADTKDNSKECAIPLPAKASLCAVRASASILSVDTGLVKYAQRTLCETDR